MCQKYDIAIVGSGPAGLSAALNAKIRNKKFIIFGNSNLSSKLEKAPKVNNYLGLYNISGKQLKEKFHNHLKEMDIKITEKRINSIYSMGNYFVLAANKEYYEAKTIILATGVDFNKEIEGEEEFLGHGVGYCATCDAPLYAGRTVSIISYHEDGERDANYVKELAGKVYYIPMYKGNYNLNKDIDVIIDKPTKIEGKEVVNKLTMKNRVILTDGIFLLRESISPKQLVPGLKIEKNYIIVNKNMETNIKGCFAAGDCVGTPYQFIKAAGEGNAASLSAISYLSKL